MTVIHGNDSNGANDRIDTNGHTHTNGYTSTNACIKGNAQDAATDRETTMDTPTRILAATDFSASAGDAVERATLLAQVLGGELDLLHVVGQHRLVELARLLHEVVDDARVQAEEAAAGALREQVVVILDRHGLPARPIHLSGPVPATIAAIADRENATLLVLGARGENPVRDFLLGSVPERVLRKTRRPLLVVRHAPATSYRQVLLPTDFSDDARHALTLAARLAPQATLTLLHVVDAPLEAKLEFAGVAPAEIEAYRGQCRRHAEVELQRFLADLPAADKRRIVPDVAIGHPSAVILEKARALGADLIATGKHGRLPVEEWVLGSVTMHLLQNAPCDVLVAGNR